MLQLERVFYVEVKMNPKKMSWEFVTVGMKTYQFKNGKIKWIIDWRR